MTDETEQLGEAEQFVDLSHVFPWLTPEERLRLFLAGLPKEQADQVIELLERANGDDDE